MSLSFRLNFRILLEFNRASTSQFWRLKTHNRCHRSCQFFDPCHPSLPTILHLFVPPMTRSSIGLFVLHASVRRRTPESAMERTMTVRMVTPMTNIGHPRHRLRTSANEFLLAGKARAIAPKSSFHRRTGRARARLAIHSRMIQSTISRTTRPSKPWTFNVPYVLGCRSTNDCRIFNDTFVPIFALEMTMLTTAGGAKVYSGNPATLTASRIMPCRMNFGVKGA